MQTIHHSFKSITEVKRSKFITYLVPIEEFKEKQETLKKEHPKARHIVYALRYLNEFHQIVENATDDGEPKGSAGTPTLNVLRGQEMINSAVLIVRYFGGIKLGVGGLVRAYSLAVKDVLEIASLEPYENEILYEFNSSYKEIDKILYQLNHLEIKNFYRDFDIHEVKWKIQTSEFKIKKLQKFLTP